MKKPQYITISIAAIALILLLVFARTKEKAAHSIGDGHNHSAQHVDNDAVSSNISIDTLLAASKKSLTNEQNIRLNMLEQSVSKSNVKQQKSDIYHQLAHFWRDTGKAFIPYAWYTAESARLENSEKSLTFAAHLFLDRLQEQENAGIRKWMALQSKDLFERSLILNPGNDSSKVGIGATYLFGGISSAPMEGIAKIREVVQRDSTNVYAQMTMAMGSLLSGQEDKARERLETVTRLQPNNIQAILLLGDMFEKKGDKTAAVHYYTKALPLVKRPDIKGELEKRISTLKN